MAYKALPIVEVGLDELRVDLGNYRIPDRPTSQAAAMDYLFLYADTVGLARMILRDGYFDSEPLIAVEDKPGYVVLEGNRRLSALKALRDPAVVPEHEATIRALLKRFQLEAENLPDTVRVLIAPSRASARQHIARLHTTQSKKPWGRDEQANYYYNSVRNGTQTVEQLKQEFPGVNVVRFIKLAVMRRFLKGVKFRDESLHVYVTKPGLKMSGVEYAYRPSEIAEAMGVFFAEDGQLRPLTKTPEAIGAALKKRQREAVEYLMTQFRAPGGFNTRSDEFRPGTDEYTDLVNRLWGRSPGESAGSPTGEGGDEPEADDPADPESGNDGDGAGGTGTGTGGSPEDGGDETGRRGPNHPDTKDKLDLAGLDYSTHVPTNLQRRYHELRRLNLRDTPIAAALLLRTVLETTIKFHFEASATPASRELSEVFKLVASTYGKEKSLRNAISRVQNGPASTPGSIQWFNQAAHSIDAVITAQDVRDAFLLVNPLLRRLLRPPASPGT